jgi:hypothetical protein
VESQPRGVQQAFQKQGVQQQRMHTVTLQDDACVCRLCGACVRAGLCDIQTCVLALLSFPGPVDQQMSACRLFVLVQVMSDLVADKLGADAGTVLAAMLSHGRRFETAVQVSLQLSLLPCLWRCVHSPGGQGPSSHAQASAACMFLQTSAHV